jgi:hypothetical protein
MQILLELSLKTAAGRTPQNEWIPTPFRIAKTTQLMLPVPMSEF